MQTLIDKEYKPSFNFPGLQDRAMPKNADVAVPEPKKVTKTKKTIDSIPTPGTTSGTKKLLISKPKY